MSKLPSPNSKSAGGSMHASQTKQEESAIAGTSAAPGLSTALSSSESLQMLFSRHGHGAMAPSVTNVQPSQMDHDLLQADTKWQNALAGISNFRETFDDEEKVAMTPFATDQRMLLAGFISDQLECAEESQQQQQLQLGGLRKSRNIAAAGYEQALKLANMHHARLQAQLFHITDSSIQRLKCHQPLVEAAAIAFHQLQEMEMHGEGKLAGAIASQAKDFLESVADTVVDTRAQTPKPNIPVDLESIGAHLLPNHPKLGSALSEAQDTLEDDLPLKPLF